MNHIGFYICKAEDLKRKLLSNKGNVVHKSGFFTQKIVTTTAQLDVGDYIVIPCTLDARKLGPFTLRTSGGTLTPIDESRDWHQYACYGYWHGTSAGGCKHHKSFKGNPKVRIHVTGQSDKPNDSPRGTTSRIVLVVAVTQPMSGTGSAVGVYVLQAEPGPAPERLYTKDVVWSTEFVEGGDLDVVGQGELQPGHYTIVPCTFDQAIEGEFQLTIYSDTIVHVLEQDSYFGERVKA